MNVFQIILIGMMLAAVGCIVQIASAPIFAISYATVRKRSWPVIVGAEVIIAVVFCIFNGVHPSTHGIAGMLAWHGTRFAVSCIEGVLNNKLHNIASDRVYKRKPMAIFHVIVAALVAQYLQYQIVLLLY